MTVESTLILPGMDGTAKLLLEFMHALPSHLHKKIPVYPEQVVLSYDRLAQIVQSMCEDSPPLVLIAESFSTPLAIRIAAESPTNLRGLILCAGFATSPVCGVGRWIASTLAPLLARIVLPETSIRSWLVGRDAPPTLIKTVRETIAFIDPAVLAARLRAVLACDVRSDLRRVAVPMLYMQAQGDRLVPTRCLAEIRGIRPEIRAVVVDGPHFLLQAKPKQAAGIVAEFLETLG
jgi:pimeloyl-[acyl-carrier protein] methyl ester esterase